MNVFISSFRCEKTENSSSKPLSPIYRGSCPTFMGRVRSKKNTLTRSTSMQTALLPYWYVHPLCCIKIIVLSQNLFERDSSIICGFFSAVPSDSGQLCPYSQRPEGAYRQHVPEQRSASQQAKASSSTPTADDAFCFHETHWGKQVLGKHWRSDCHTSWRSTPSDTTQFHATWRGIGWYRATRGSHQSGKLR